MRWHRKLKTLLPLRPIEKRHRPRPRVLLQLEELETRALLSASSATPVAPTTTTAPKEVVPPSSTPPLSQDAHPMLTVSPQKVSAQQTSGISGNTPQEIRQAYGFDQLPSTINGAGETIAIVDAYYDPNILTNPSNPDGQLGDANEFSKEFNLPLFNSAGGPTLTVVASGGGSASSLSQDSTGGWPLETSLDVEWVHAMAPQANILLVEAPDEGNDSMFNAVAYAASQPGVVAVSMSWGTNEFPGEGVYDSSFIPPQSNPGVAFVAASGDYGAGAIYPAASPYVLAVGGTTLGGSTSTTGGGGGTGGTLGTGGFGSSFGSFTSLGSGFSSFARAGGGLYSGSGSLSIAPTATPGGSGTNPNYPGETAWSGSGGGPASYEGYPSYQYNQPWIAQNYDSPGTLYNVEVTNNTTGVTNYYSARMTPDVAYNADPNTGYAVYDSIPAQSYGTNAGWNVVGGTSAAAPQWSAILALADQERGAQGGTALDTNQVLNTLYNTLGSSPTNTTYTSVFHDITTGSNGYAAGPGYDLATGLGSPIVNNLVPLLAGTTIAQGGLPTITGSGYGGSGGGGGTGSLGGSSGFSSGGGYGFSARSQPGGGLFAGSGSVSLPPASSNVNDLTGASMQTNAFQTPLANSLTFTLAATGAATTSTLTAANNFVGNISTLAAAAPSTASAGSTPSTTSTNAPLAQANVLFGASGWKAADLSARLANLGLSSPQRESLADDSSAKGEDGSDRSSGDLILPDSDSSGEDWSERDFAAPAQQDGSDAGDGGDG